MEDLNSEHEYVTTIKYNFSWSFSYYKNESVLLIQFWIERRCNNFLLVIASIIFLLSYKFILVMLYILFYKHVKKYFLLHTGGFKQSVAAASPCRICHISKSDLSEITPKPSPSLCWSGIKFRCFNALWSKLQITPLRSIRLWIVFSDAKWFNACYDGRNYAPLSGDCNGRFIESSIDTF